MKSGAEDSPAPQEFPRAHRWARERGPCALWFSFKTFGIKHAQEVRAPGAPCLWGGNSRPEGPARVSISLSQTGLLGILGRQPHWGASHAPSGTEQHPCSPPTRGQEDPPGVTNQAAPDVLRVPGGSGPKLSTPRVAPGFQAHEQSNWNAPTLLAGEGHHAAAQGGRWQSL